MSKRDKSTSGPSAAEAPRRSNPGIEVVNIYGSGPEPVGLREDAPQETDYDKARPDSKPADSKPGDMHGSERSPGKRPS